MGVNPRPRMRWPLATFWETNLNKPSTLSHVSVHEGNAGRCKEVAVGRSGTLHSSSSPFARLDGADVARRAGIASVADAAALGQSQPRCQISHASIQLSALPMPRTLRRRTPARHLQHLERHRADHPVHDALRVVAGRPRAELGAVCIQATGRVKKASQRNMTSKDGSAATNPRAPPRLRRLHTPQ